MIIIFIIALMYGYCTMQYFGWNLTPQSDAEMICDGIVAILCAIALLAGKKK